VDCGKQFLRAEDRERHVLQAHSPLPIQLTLCGISTCRKTFVRREERDYHMSTFHPGVLRCDICNYCSMYQENLNRHEKRMHGKKQIEIVAPPLKKKRGRPCKIKILTS